jgi:hypothetical protein
VGFVADRGGHLDVLKWLREIGFGLNADLFCGAARDGRRCLLDSLADDPGVRGDAI